MTEIDFIPQWYRASRKRRLWYQRQVLILSIVAILAALWCFVAGRGLSRARAELTAARSDFEAGIGKVQQCERLQIRYSELQTKARILDSIVPRTPYAAVLAELSHCIGPDIVMKKLDIHSEPIDPGQGMVSFGAAGKAARRNSAASASKAVKELPVTQTCVGLMGYAADAKQVAATISTLEQSDYFCHVVPVYSKNETVGGRDVTEFEIRCVLADFELLSEKE